MRALSPPRGGSRRAASLRLCVLSGEAGPQGGHAGVPFLAISLVTFQSQGGHGATQRTVGSTPVPWPGRPARAQGPGEARHSDGHGRCCGKTRPVPTPGLDSHTRRSRLSLCPASWRPCTPSPRWNSKTLAATWSRPPGWRGGRVQAPGRLALACAPQKQQQGVSAAQPPEPRTREQNTGPVQVDPGWLRLHPHQ